ncbi:hypothetical protein R3P38DRAFT_2808491 [Favolaschia claudopus]|uniref:Uncharacterized protein n=1 Tax=Favolaschia claudopus TaxID=2862362 RepID=A0AAV9ZGH4_9AGAR
MFNSRIGIRRSLRVGAAKDAHDGRVGRIAGARVLPFCDAVHLEWLRLTLVFAVIGGTSLCRPHVTDESANSVSSLNKHFAARKLAKRPKYAPENRPPEKPVPRSILGIDSNACPRRFAPVHIPSVWEKIGEERPNVTGRRGFKVLKPAIETERTISRLSRTRNGNYKCIKTIQYCLGGLPLAQATVGSSDSSLCQLGFVYLNARVVPEYEAHTNLIVG